MAKKDMTEKLEEKTVKQLREKAVKLGMPKEDAEVFDTKKPLIATINALRASRAAKKVETLEDKGTPAEQKKTEKQWLSKAEKMRDRLEKQPKIRFFIPLVDPEKPGVVKRVKIKGRMETVHVSGAIETVILNGYKTIIPKGVFCEIPQQVAEVLEEAYRLTSEAGKELLIERIDPETGKPVSERLTR